ncbi:MAG: 3-deoxy-8-phosphooctulonate synthase [Bdellovibrio sp.]|nr:MAG: 3-deoxy-8-phosphooctulonate synthase [Bdellovibrio sp.]
MNQYKKQNTLFCFAGLNVLEDESLALETAHFLKETTEKLNIPFAFKASFDKANRSSIKSYRGPGLDKGLQILQTVKDKLHIPLLTDLHEPFQADPVAQVVDILQIPAFLCRQTDLVVATSKAAQKYQRLIHVKKAQFMAPWDSKNIIDKITEVMGHSSSIILCERGSCFGYNNLVVDMLAIYEMQQLGVPVTIDATHAVQLPGGQKTSTGGRRYGVPLIAKAAVAAGADGVFLEFHPEPQKAKCDGPSCLPLTSAPQLLKQLRDIYNLTHKEQ